MNSFLEEGKKARFKPKILFQILIFIGIFFLIGLGQTIVYLISIRLVPFMITPSMDLLISLFCTIVTILFSILYCLKVEKRSLFSMGFTKKNLVREYFAGLVLGFILIGLSLVINILFNNATYEGFRLGGTFTSIIILPLFFIGFLIQGLSEEVLLRGYFMVSLNNSSTLIKAILINSLLFSLLHLSNPSISLLSVVNIGLFGIFASLLMIIRGSIWMIAGVHSMWNFTQGNIFGINVSGIDMEFSLLSFGLKDNIISGGEFGLEGGLVVTTILILAIIFLGIKTRNKDVI